MAKLATIKHDDAGNVIITHTELPREPVEPAMPPSSPSKNEHTKRRVPSSPHKPYTSANFYDLTKSNSPDVSPAASASKGKENIPGVRAREHVDHVNVVPGPFAQSRTIPIPSANTMDSEKSTNQSGKKPPHFIDPATLLPPNSSLWKSTKVDVRKPVWDGFSTNRSALRPNSDTNIDRPGTHHNLNRPSPHNPSIFVGPSKNTATPIPMPSNPPRAAPFIPSSSFIHPDSIRPREPLEQPMSAEKADEALKEFFESALVPEKEDEVPQSTEDKSGVIQGLKVTLMPHQIEGLEFLQDHESNDSKAKGKGKYGGILADDMGLGKTIQALALILTHPRPPPDGEKLFYSTAQYCKGTLLVVPLALADQWRQEVTEKTTLKAYVHHGPKREKDPARLARWDVVITTYDTVSSEWFQRDKSDDNTEPSINGRGIFLVNWWRVILDEAHTIKNRKAKMSQACCALSARFRWCLTGTPYQNTVDDVYSLVKFLRIPPFADWEYWRERISGPAKNERMSLALSRLRTLLRAIMIRRTKDVLKELGVLIPPKEIISEELDFDPTERKFYDDLLVRGQQVIEELKNTRGGLSKSYMCLLTMLLRLRQATDHIDLLKGKVEEDKDALNDKAVPENKADKDLDDDLVAMMGGLGIEAKCSICFTIITTGRERCDDCEQNLQTYQTRKSHPGRPSSSKIRRMLEILKTPVDGDEVKTIIFSQFTSMLDLVEPFLREHNVKYGRYDGKMRKDQRDAMLNTFRTTSTPVLLVSLKCGSVGLNLTSASRVIMLDMWWNPAIEDQAIDRVHRIGQIRRVVVHKLTIRDSIDERIALLQKRKKEAANGALGDGVIRRKGMGVNKLSLEEVLFLFSMPEGHLDRI